MGYQQQSLPSQNTFSAYLLSFCMEWLCSSSRNSFHISLNTLQSGQIAQREAKEACPEAQFCQILLFGDLVFIFTMGADITLTGYKCPSLVYLVWGQESNQEKLKMVRFCCTSFRIFLLTILCFGVKSPQTSFKPFLWPTPNPSFWHKRQRIVC